MEEVAPCKSTQEYLKSHETFPPHPSQREGKEAPHVFHKHTPRPTTPYPVIHPSGRLKRSGNLRVIKSEAKSSFSPTRLAIRARRLGRRRFSIPTPIRNNNVLLPRRFFLLLLLLSLPTRLIQPLLLGKFILIIITPIILVDLKKHIAVCDSQDIIQPEYVERLERREERRGDVVRDPAFVLLCRPVELVRPDGLEFVEFGIDDAQIEVVTLVDPDEDEEGEVGSDKGMVKIIKGFGGLDV